MHSFEGRNEDSTSQIKKVKSVQWNSEIALTYTIESARFDDQRHISWQRPY